MTKIENVSFRPIGYISSLHKEMAKTPIQPVFSQGIEGKVILDSQYAEGLKGLEGFSHIYLFFYFDKSQKTCLQVKPYLADEKRGIFATRAPHRPNKLGMSLVRLLRIEENILYVSDLDILDGTPLIDIKPYIQRFDYRENTKSGWQDEISDESASIKGLRDFKKQ